MSELRDRELRDLLERVSAIDGDVDVDEHWMQGRRRRTRRGAGLALVTGAVAVTAAAGLAQTGLLGGSDPAPTGPAAVPDSLETFVLSGQETAGTALPGPSAALRAATPDDLAGTSWTLQDGMWNASTSAPDLTGTTGTTVLAFGGTGPGPGGWGIEVDGCGSVGVDELSLDGRGRFPASVPSTTDIGCPDDVQAAEDFWIDALAGGGQLTVVEDGRWLLLSVDAPAPPEPGPPAEPGPRPPATPRPDESGAPTGGGATVPGDDDGAAPPGEPARTPTERGGPEPTTDDEQPPGPDPAPPPTTDAAPPPTPGAGPVAPTVPADPTAPTVAEGFTGPSAASVDPPWPGGGGELFAPSVRAGVHEGFDRVVVDLTGTGDPGWRAAYTDDPRLDGSGFASDVAGDSVLELSLSGMAYPDPGSEVYSEGTFGLDTHTLTAVVEVHRTTPFEGMLQVFVGMQGDPRPYRVFLLQDPMRLVVDVQTSS
ncbi:AMIN-like domain-containing (lipo)protein [Ornithinimicrobium pekingense]|uniref:AMIN-like domain-containing protein n=1 Tax=Ornithinimicrobium pekingense TaxID=384677 RepID=A0ABQ2F600_9MICO|nr:hypothetical protein [Ornithinimicrobium pekingense]GGK61416.1 hypothetical protein GCM10011509_07300 [Ornithinimicrobium pekingense]